VKTKFKMKLGLNASRPGEKLPLAKSVKLPLIKSKEAPELDKNFLKKCSTGIKKKTEGSEFEIVNIRWCEMLGVVRCPGFFLL